jgi:hypothetical protein
MSKQITADDLSEITARLLKNDDDSYLPHPEQFMADLAELICDFCGGMVTGPADEQDGELMVGITRNEFLPEDGGIWKDCDEEGEL